MSGDDKSRVYQGEFRAQELFALKALVDEGLDEVTDAQILFLTLKKSLDRFMPR